MKSMTKRIVQLDGLRAIAVAAVFLQHMFGIKLLWMGVDLFFILSGFLITGILLDQRSKSLGRYFKHFYGRRARRILPPYILFLCVGLLLYGTWWLNRWYLYAFLMNVILATHVGTPAAFGPLWSLAVEEQFYLVWPFAVYFLSESHLFRLATVLMIVAPVLRWICTPWFSSHFAIYALTPFRMDTLAAGALIAILWRRNRDKVERFAQYGLLLSAAAVLALVLCSRFFGLSTFNDTPAGNMWIYEFSLLTCTGAFLWALSGRGVQVLRLPPMVYLGRISYSMYLIQVAAIVEMEGYLHSRTAIALASAAIMLTYAALSWHFLEKPILERKAAPLGAFVRQ